MISSLFPLFSGLRSSCPCLDNRYRLYMTLGEGRHARVKLAYDEKRQKHVAIKMVPKIFNELQVSMLFNEILALKQLKKGSFTSIINFNFFGNVQFINGTQYRTAYYTMKIEENGELYQYIETTGSFDESMTRKLFGELLEGVNSIHKKNICHRDIKTENILLGKDYKLKLCDFGACSTITPDSCSQHHQVIKSPMEAVGSPEYNAPELNYGQMKMNPTGLKKADIFSLGCALFLIVVNSLPFRSASHDDPYFKRLCGEDVKKFWDIYDKEEIQFSANFKDLFQGMTRAEVSERFSIEDIIKHPWMTTTKAMPVKQFQKEMESRVKKVSQHYHNMAVEQISKLKSGKGQSYKNYDHWSVPESLEEYLYSLKGKLAKFSSEHEDSSSEQSSSDSSSIHETKFKIKSKRKVTSDTADNLPQPEWKEEPKLSRDQSDDSSFPWFFSDPEDKEKKQ